MSSILVPYLGEKLQILYQSGIRPDIDQHEKLAKKIGLMGGGSLSNYANGTGGAKKDRVPGRRFSQICLVFGIGADDFTTPDLALFREKIQERAPGWRRLQDLAQPAGDRIVVETVVDGERGVSVVRHDERPLGVELRIGDRFAVEISAPALAGRHVALFLNDPDRTPRLMNPGAHIETGASRLREPTMRFPEDPHACFRADWPLGQHFWLALFTDRPFEAAEAEALSDSSLAVRRAAIERLVKTLDQTPEPRWHLCREAFYVQL